MSIESIQDKVKNTLKQIGNDIEELFFTNYYGGSAEFQKFLKYNFDKKSIKGWDLDGQWKHLSKRYEGSTEYVNVVLIHQVYSYSENGEKVYVQFSGRHDPDDGEKYARYSFVTPKEVISTVWEPA